MLLLLLSQFFRGIAEDNKGSEKIDLTPTLIFCIGIIMIATYSCSAIIFPEDTTDYLDSYDRFGGVQGAEVTFSVWLDLNFDLAYQHIFNGIQIDNRRVYSVLTYNYINDHYKDSMMGWDKSHLGIFETYDYTTGGAGWRWYNSDWVKGQGFFEWAFGETRADRINNEYHKYLQDIGVEEKPQGNLIDTITELLANVWDGFTQLLRLLTFTNIPNMPVWVLGILAIFFIPMWIVLIVGITPYVVEIIKAISSFIESWTPW